jgi:hypothetical protein
VRQPRQWFDPPQLLSGALRENGIGSFCARQRAVGRGAECLALSHELAQREFPSARTALITAERRCNMVLYGQRGLTQDKT